MGKTAWFKRILTLSFKPTVATPINRFVTDDGDLSTVAATRGAGISFDSADAEDIAAKRSIGVTIIGIEELELGATVTKNAFVTNDTQGRGVTATTGQAIRAQVLEGGDLGDRVPALLIKGPVVAP